MERYRDFIHAVMKRTGISPDASLSTIALVIRAVAQQLNPSELVVLKTMLVPELRQLLVESRLFDRSSNGTNGRELIESVSAALEISDAQAKSRILGVLDELRAGVSLWDDVMNLQLLDRVRAAVDQQLLQAAVA